MLGNDRDPIVTYVVHHLDSVLYAGIGESRRKIGVPKQPALIREGLEWLDQVYSERYGDKFISLEEADQQQAVEQLVQGNLASRSGTDRVPVKDWVDKILTEAVAAYYSHPFIWS